jgi:hypothetical protein
VRTKIFFITLFLGWLLPIAVAAQDNESVQSTANFHHRASSLVNPRDAVVVGNVRGIVSKHTVGTPVGTRLLLNSAQGPVDINLGPYLSTDVRASLAKAQLVQVIGIPRNFNGKNSLLAREIVFSGRQVTIRNEYGFLLRGNGRPQKQNQNNFGGGR